MPGLGVTLRLEELPETQLPGDATEELAGGKVDLRIGMSLVSPKPMDPERC